jgi:hypothetical protein
MLAPGGNGSQLALRVRPVRGDLPPHGKSPKGSQQPMAATAGRVTVRDASSVGDWFPDEFGNVDHEVGALPIRILRRADLTHTHAHHVIEAAVAVAVAEVKDAADDLPSPRWVGAAISVPLEHDGRAVVGVDDGAEVWTERPRCGSTMRKVRAAEATTDGALAAALGEQQVLFPPALEPDHPALWIGEANPIQLLQPQRWTPATSEPAVPGALQTRSATAQVRGRRSASNPNAALRHEAWCQVLLRLA